MKTLTLIISVLVAGLVSAQEGGKPAVPSSAADVASRKGPTTSKSEDIQEGPAAKKEPRVAVVTSIEPEALAGFEHYAPQLQQLVRDALTLTKLNLTYTFGASNPKQGGMDCSGTIWHLLNGLGLKGVPRQSNEIAGWVQSNTLLHRTPTADSLKHPEFAALQPGDLLFWTGTYQTAPRKIPVTHVMLYLGKLKKSGRAVVFGASDGRVYQGERRTGVSVFDFSLPVPGGSSAFYGYGLIPGVGRIEAKPVQPPTPQPVVAKASVEPVKAAPEVVGKPAIKEDVRPAVIPPSSQEKLVAASSPAVRYTERDTASATASSKPKSVETASNKPRSMVASPTASSAPKAKATKPTATRKKSPPPPTAQEQLGKAVKKIGSSFKELFSN